jgi:hypothetical protein
MYNLEPEDYLSEETWCSKILGTSMWGDSTSYPTLYILLMVLSLLEINVMQLIAVLNKKYNN